MNFNATFIVVAINFIVFSLIMNAIFYKPLSNIVEKRQKFIDENYEEAAKAKEKSHAILADREQKLEQTKTDAKKIISDKTETIKTQKTVLTTAAQQSAQQKISSAKDELQQSKSEAQEVLSNRVIDLAQNISSKLLGENIEVQEADKGLIDKIMQEG